jgi:hypothetical protein
MSRREFRRGGSRAGRGDSLSLQRLRLRRWEPNRSYHEKPARRFPPPWSVAARHDCLRSFTYQSKLVIHSPTVTARTTATAMSANTLSV